MVPRGRSLGATLFGAGPGRWDLPDPSCATTSDPDEPRPGTGVAKQPQAYSRLGESSRWFWEFAEAGSEEVQVQRSPE